MKNISNSKKTNLFKKIFVKICRKLGFELIDQSNFTIQTLNKSADQSLSSYGKKNISKKMNSYIQQDKKQNRIDNDTPLILEEIYELLIENKMTCHYCNENVFIYYEKYRDNKQWTLERKDNKLPHFKNNCVIACLECNLQRRNKNMDNFKFTKKLIIHKN